MNSVTFVTCVRAPPHYRKQCSPIMTRLRLSLLGHFYVELGEESVSYFATNKVQALLVYLAVEVKRPFPSTKATSCLNSTSVNNDYP